MKIKEGKTHKKIQSKGEFKKMFDFKQESKEKYYKIAEKKIKKIKAEEVIKIDRDRFSVLAGKKVKVFIKPIRKKDNLQLWQKIKKKIPEFREEEIEKKPQVKETSIFLSGYFLLDM